MRPLSPLLVFLLLVAATPVRVDADRRSFTSALESITHSELKSHVDVLADDTFEGREAGARGGYAAGGYIARQLEQLGLKPAGDRGSYFQSFTGNGRNILAL